jgi:hypothetical protein
MHWMLARWRSTLAHMFIIINSARIGFQNGSSEFLDCRASNSPILICRNFSCIGGVVD